MSKLRVAYRETIDVSSVREYEYEQRMGDRTLGATVRSWCSSAKRENFKYPSNDTNNTYHSHVSLYA